MEIECIPPYIIVKGNNLTKSIELNVQKTNSPNTLVKNCATLLEDLLTGKLTFINVFALDTIIIDEDFIEGGLGLSLAIIAPKWKVIGKRKLELNGAGGKSYYDNKFHFVITFGETISKAQNGTFPGGNGADGKPGRPGGPSGSFFGIAGQIVNGTNLEIITSGGVGDIGEEGGNGVHGKDGESAKVPSGNSCRSYLCDNNRKINGFNCEKVRCNYHHSPVAHGTSAQFEGCKYKIFGRPGTRGGNGGNGGRGGKGGNFGNISLFELNSDSGVSLHKKTGEDGKNGKGGLRGLGGKRGNDVVVTCTMSLIWGDTWELDETVYNGNERSSPGRNGRNGATIRNMDEPNAAIAIDDKFVEILNQYKTYLRENLKEQSEKSLLMQFLNELDTNANVKNIYDTMGFIDELQGLENQFHELNEEVNFLPFYQSLLNRISEYAQHPKQYENSIEHKKVLNYLYTTALSKINNMNGSLEFSLIINIAAYLGLVNEDVIKLKDIKNAKNKADIINKYRQDYKNRIDAKIKEAQELISVEITSEISNINTEIDNKIESLINEVLRLQEHNTAELNELNKKKQQLEKALVLQATFVPFKTVGKMVGYLGPIGEFAGSVAEMGSATVEALALDDHHIQYGKLKLPLSVTEMSTNEVNDKRIIHFNNILDELSEKINKLPEKFIHLSERIDDIKNRLNEKSKHEINFNDILTLEDELIEELKLKKENLIETGDVISNGENAKELEVVKYFLKAVTQFRLVGIDIYSRYKNDQSKLNAIAEAIKNAEDEFEKLRQYEEKIYYTISPLLQNIKSDLSDVERKLGSKSKIALEVTKWQVQSSLRDTIVLMQQLTEGFYEKDNLVRCIKKLEEAMNTLINVYDHIQYYQEDKKFADYIADISSTSASNINIVHPKLRNATDYLEITIRSNIVLQRYQTAIDAFKQFVFPLAHVYFKNLILPSHLELRGNRNETDLGNLVDTAAEQIEHVRSKLQRYKISLMNHDRPFGRGVFNSHYDATQPFFMWKNEQHKIMISKLLSGEEVTVKADIFNSTPNQDAIKFNIIELEFKTKNETKQSEINMILKSFNVSMTHLGDSYYRCNDKIYLMASNSIDIWYYFDKKKHQIDEPVHRSDTYDNIKDGDFMLSPYASWKIKLINLANRNNFTFKDLVIYKDEVDLELIGNGRYVNKGVVSDLVLEKYYKAFHTYDWQYKNTESDVYDGILEDANSTTEEAEVNGEIKTTIVNDLIREKYYEELPTSDLQNENTESYVTDVVSLLDDTNSARNKREIKYELKTTVDHESQEKNTGNTNYRDWFSWIKFPRFNILPGAEAVVIKDVSVMNQVSHVTLSLDNILVPIFKDMKLFKDAVSSKVSKFLDNNTYSTSSEEVLIDDYIQHIVKDNSTNMSNGFEISCTIAKNNNGIQVMPTVDIMGNLILGQIFIHKMFAGNKYPNDTRYLSPEQEQCSIINRLELEILPVLNKKSYTNNTCFVSKSIIIILLIMIIILFFGIRICGKIIS